MDTEHVKGRIQAGMEHIDRQIEDLRDEISRLELQKARFHETFEAIVTAEALVNQSDQLLGSPLQEMDSEGPEEADAVASGEAVAEDRVAESPVAGFQAPVAQQSADQADSALNAEPEMLLPKFLREDL